MSSTRTHLTSEQEHVIVHKGTEMPYTGALLGEHRTGKFLCTRCRSPLYSSTMKFDSSCGWPSFDDTIPGQVQEIADRDGHRIEIVCKNCQGHLGHIFRGERLTDKNTRHCVNSVSMVFVPDTIVDTTQDITSNTTRSNKNMQIATF
jgi:methionine-R-sulfoxide reductase